MEIKIDPERLQQVYRRKLAEANEQLITMEALVSQQAMAIQELQRENGEMRLERDQLLTQTGRQDGAQWETTSV